MSGGTITPRSPTEITPVCGAEVEDLAVALFPRLVEGVDPDPMDSPQAARAKTVARVTTFLIIGVETGWGTFAVPLDVV